MAELKKPMTDNKIRLRQILVKTGSVKNPFRLVLALPGRSLEHSFAPDEQISLTAMKLRQIADRLDRIQEEADEDESN